MTPFDLNGKFRSVSYHDSLPRLAVRGAGVTVFFQTVSLVVQTIATVALARLLKPADFGVVTIVTTISLLLSSAGLNGFSEAIIQRDEIDRRLVSNLFWINLALGGLLSAGFAAAGSLLARLYGDPRVGEVAIGMSVTILLAGTSVQHLALLKRAMYFAVLSRLDIVARAISVLVSIWCGWKGWGYWALVAGSIAYALVASIGAWWLCRWVPSPPSRAAGTAAAVWYATHVYGRFSLNYCARNMDNALVGWRFGAGSLGFYKKAYDLFALSANQLVAPLSVVAVSSLSRLRRDSARYQQSFLQGLAAMAFVGMGLGAVLSLAGDDLIRLLLGSGWEPAAQIFRWFGPGVGAMLIYNTHGWIHLSIGTPDRWLRWGILEVSITGLLFVLGLAWGPVGVAAAWTTSFWILIVPAFLYAGKPINLGVRPIVGAVWKYAVASLLAAGSALVHIRFIPYFANVDPTWTGTARHALKVSGLFGLLYLTAIVLLHRGTAPLSQFLRLLKAAMPSKRSAISTCDKPYSLMPATGLTRTSAEEIASHS